MGITSRHYIFAENGALKRVPRRILDGLIFGQDAIPEYARTRQRVATALIRNEEQKPTFLLDLQGSYWSFDDEGRIDRSLQESMFEGMRFANPYMDDEKVVSLTPAIKKREYLSRYRWEPTKDEWDRVAADIWPGIHGVAEDVALVAGKAPKRPPMTASARKALIEIHAKVNMISLTLDDLSEPSLKGLAFELRRTATFEREASVWDGLAKECERQLEIKKRYRTGKGAWYAIVESVTERFDNSRIVDLHVLAHEKCPNRKAAVEAARRLLKEKADTFSATTALDTYVKCELEWAPEDDW